MAHPAGGMVGICWSAPAVSGMFSNHTTNLLDSGNFWNVVNVFTYALYFFLGDSDQSYPGKIPCGKRNICRGDCTSSSCSLIDNVSTWEDLNFLLETKQLGDLNISEELITIISEHASKSGIDSSELWAAIYKPVIIAAYFLIMLLIFFKLVALEEEKKNLESKFEIIRLKDLHSKHLKRQEQLIERRNKIYSEWRQKVECLVEDLQSMIDQVRNCSDGNLLTPSQVRCYFGQLEQAQNEFDSNIDEFGNMEEFHLEEGEQSVRECKDIHRSLVERLRSLVSPLEKTESDLSLLYQHLSELDKVVEGRIDFQECLSVLLAALNRDLEDLDL